MSSLNISSSLDKIRKHIDYNYLNVSGAVIRSNRTSLDDHLSRAIKNDHVTVLGEKSGNAIVPLLSQLILSSIQ
jgi:hypothetical protein